MTLALQTPPDVMTSNAALWVEKITGHLPARPNQIATWLTAPAVLLMLTPLWAFLWRKWRDRPATIDDWLKDGGAQLETIVDQLIAAKNQSNKAVIDRRMSAERWVPLHEALRYLVYESEWAQQQARPTSQADFDRVVSMEMLERLARGDLHARGVKGGGFSNPDRPTEEIPLYYWTHAFVQPHGEIVMADPNRAAAGNSTGSDTYRRVILSSDDMVSIWPRGQIKTISRLASFVEPAREQYEKSKVAADTENRQRRHAVISNPGTHPSLP